MTKNTRLRLARRLNQTSRALDSASKGTSRAGWSLLGLAFWIVVAIIAVPIGLKLLGL